MVRFKLPARKGPLEEDLGKESGTRWSGAVFAPIMFLSALSTLPYYTITNMYINQRLMEDLLDYQGNASYQVRGEGM